jgi:hypothetical protein
MDDGESQEVYDSGAEAFDVLRQRKSESAYYRARAAMSYAGRT